MNIIPKTGIVPETGIIRKLYDDAITNEIEYTSSAFWQTYLQTHFNPDNNHAVVCEYSPDESLKRVDITVLQYNSSHHTLLRLILLEAKRPGKQPKEVENQALRSARQAISKSNLTGIFAITTIGLYYRTWHVGHQGGLQPLHGESPPGDKNAYIHAGSEEACALVEDIRLIKGETPLMIAPTLPSQRHLFQDLSASTSDYATNSQLSHQNIGEQASESAQTEDLGSAQGDDRPWYEVQLGRKRI